MRLGGADAALLAAVTLVGLAGGVGAYTFVYARGASYLTDDPAACANCHVMETQLSGWLQSSHRSVAVCNDCHTPPGLVPKYLTKAINGFNHSFAFTSGRFPEPILITLRNRGVTEAACRKCHAPMVEAIDAHGGSPDTRLACLACHRDVGHLH
ncbi:MAG: cytochrome c nitrite reductase small subunit [Thermoanaerobaculia bacterium]|nr:MAG: cytochrome c nitrite reductase small subunit [Thermoanaerobaculia bacterium]